MTAEQDPTEAVIDWIGRMTARFGPSVFDHELGRQWDWGQALCREQYGPGWTTLALEEPTLESPSGLRLPGKPAGGPSGPPMLSMRWR